MLQGKKKALTAMKNGQAGVLVEINGGAGMRAKLEAMGVRLGARITKKSALMGGGPVIIGVGNTEIAIGYGMASRILMEVEE